MSAGYSRTAWICPPVIAVVIVAASFLPEKWAIVLAFPTFGRRKHNFGSTYVQPTWLIQFQSSDRILGLVQV